MLNQQEKTERFAAEINRNAAKVIQKIEKQTEKISKNQLSEFEEAAANEMESRMDEAKRRILARQNRAQAAFLQERRREAALHRDEIVKGVFDEAEKRLLSFCETPDYTLLLERCIKSLAVSIGGDCTVFVKESDLPAAKEICASIDNVKAVEGSASIRLGLANAENGDRTVFLSDTLDTRIAAYRETFLSDCGLRVQPEEVTK